MAIELPNLLYCGVAGLIGFIWGLGEIVSAFKNETGRALATAGAWLLILLNFVAAAGIFLLTAAIIPEANNWLTAIFVGFAWPTVIRNASFKLAQPLQSDNGQEQAAIRFEQAYATFQGLARSLINNALTRQRIQLVTSATNYDLATLERYARLALIASPLQTGDGLPAADFIDAIIARPGTEEIKKALLAAFVMANFGRDMLQDFIKERMKEQRRKPNR